MDDRSNHRLIVAIERFIEAWDGTSIGQDVQNLYENGTGYEHICKRMGIDYDDYAEING